MSEFEIQRVCCNESVVVWILRSSLLNGNSGSGAILDSHGVAELSAQDSGRWQRYRSVQKKNQFLMSRRAISCVLTEEFGIDHQLSLHTSQSGCPRLLDANRRDVAAISLSHSENVVVIGIDRNCQPLGVDCEMVRSVVPDAVWRYLGNSAGDFAEGTSLIERQWHAAIRWTEFEAGWKMLQNFHMTEHDSICNVARTEDQKGGQSEVPGQPGSLIKQMWVVHSSPHGTRVTDLASRPDSVRLSNCDDACICIISGRRNAGPKLNCFLEEANSLAS